MPQLTKNATRSAAACKGVSPLLLDRNCRLASIDFDDRSRIAAASECHMMPRHQVVYQQGESADAVYMILSGSVRLERRDAAQSVIARRDAVLYTTFGDGVLIGEVDRRYTARVHCAALLVKLPLHLLQRILVAYPDLAADWTFEILTRGKRSVPRRRSGGLLRDILDAISAA